MGFQTARACLILSTYLMLWLAVASIAQAQGKGGDLRAAMQNPISSLISLPFESNYDSGADSGDAFFVSIQPVVPVTVGDWNLVSRLILPRGKVDGGITGLPKNPSPIPDEGADGLGDYVEAGQRAFFNRSRRPTPQ